MIKRYSGESLEMYAERLHETKDEYWALLLKMYRRKEPAERATGIRALIDDYNAEIDRVLAEIEKNREDVAQ